MPKFIGHTEAMIRFIKAVLDVPSQTKQKSKVKKAKSPHHPRGMP